MDGFVDNSGGVQAPEPQATEVNVQQEPVTEQQQGFDYANATRDERRVKLESFFVEKEPEIPQTIPEQAPVNPEQLEQPAQPEQTWQYDEALSKFKNTDGSLNIDALAKSYLNAQSKIGEQGNKMGEYNRQLQELGVRLQQLEQVGQPPPQPQDTEPFEQRAEFNTDEWFDKFYSNPTEALKDALGQEGMKQVLKELLGGTVEEIIKPLNPVIEEYQFNQQKAFWEDKVAAVAAQRGDFDQYRPQIAELLKGMPESFLELDNAIEIAYLMAKGQSFDAQPKTTVGELLQNQEFLSALANNPEVQKNVLKGYSQQIAGTPKPTLIGGHAGTSAPSTPPPEIKSTRDATKAFRAYLENGRG